MEKLLSCMHDVCNKLSVILMTSKLIQKKCTLCPKQDICGGCPNLPLIKDIEDISKSISDIVNSHRNENKSLDYQTYNLSDLLNQKDILNKITDLGKETNLNISIKNTLPNEVFVSLNCNFNLEGIQFLNNIFYNAKKAEASNMRIILTDMSEHVAIHFIDDGLGMSSETIKCLGLSCASKTSTGEGTSILKKIVSKVNGTIEWSSPGTGAGCCVTLRLTKIIP